MIYSGPCFVRPQLSQWSLATNVGPSVRVSPGLKLFCKEEIIRQLMKLGKVFSFGMSK